MKRNVSLAEISDGRLYNENDMVKADCHGCKGCFVCCTGMGNSVILDPCDVYRLQAGLGKPLSVLLAEEAVELNVVDGIILPNLKMKGREERCVFLNAEGRCSVHDSRPGVCRLFPLGRYYENGDFKYFLQTKECPQAGRSKIKVSKWLDIPDLNRYHAYIRKWHDLLKELEEPAGTEDIEYAKKMNLLLLHTFYLEPYDCGEDFYAQFYGRLEQFSNALKV